MRTENLKEIVIHNVGNKTLDTPLYLSKKKVNIDSNLKSILTSYFLNAFKSEEYYYFYHDVDLSLNEVYTYISNIFTNPSSLIEQSVYIAKHLYNSSLHPKIKDGEFCVVYFSDCYINGEILDAVGLFKSENKETFLELAQVLDGFDVESRQGINLNKLDKGCLVFNTNQEKGYLVAVVDNINKNNDTQYWKENFLNIRPASDNYHFTKDFLSITKNFVTNQLINDFEVSKAEQIDLLNRSVDYFKKRESFDKQEFEKEVFADSNIIDSFRKFDQTYREENEVDLSDNFEISAQAVKKQARVFKSVLKLDKNFHIYIHGDKELIEQGVDENGRKFYKIYYDEES